MINSHAIKTAWIMSFVIAVTLWANEGATQEKKISFEVQQITSGPKHHLFGYVGHAVTIPWNESGRYIVSLQTDFYKRMPVKGETADIILLDTQNDYAITVVDKTLAWNLQQGTMLYWNPNEPEIQFFFNDIDPKTGVVFTVLYDIEKRKRIREYRFGNQSIANGGVMPNGKYFAGINYGRISIAREIISYPGTFDWTADGPANPEDDGLFKVDIATGEKHLLVSYPALAEFLKLKDRDTYPIYVHHTLWNRNSDRIVFVVRGAGSDKLPSKYPNVQCMIHADGTGLKRMEFGGHPEWYEGNQLSLPGDGVFKLVDVDTDKVMGKIGTKGTFSSPGGDNAYSPDGKWYVGSHRIDKKCTYTFYRFADKAHFIAPAIPTKSDRGVTRIDGAPRWNRTSDAILVGGVAEDGSRQLSVVWILSATE
jgi:hypothetical protein